MDEFQELVSAEVDYLRKEKPPCKSWHEGYALLYEELSEFWDEVKKKHLLRNRRNSLSELVQLAATAQKIAEDLALIDDFTKRRDDAKTPNI